MTLSDALATPLPDLRGHWLEARCCCGTDRSPLWFHAAQHPGWLLSDLVLEFVCQRCRMQPALVLLRSTRIGRSDPRWRLDLCEAFEG